MPCSLGLVEGSKVSAPVGHALLSGKPGWRVVYSSAGWRQLLHKCSLKLQERAPPAACCEVLSGKYGTHPQDKQLRRKGHRETKLRIFARIVALN